jgi:hypothetical protein
MTLTTIRTEPMLDEPPPRKPRWLGAPEPRRNGQQPPAIDEAALERAMQGNGGPVPAEVERYAPPLGGRTANSQIDPLALASQLIGPLAEHTSAAVKRMAAEIDAAATVLENRALDIRRTGQEHMLLVVNNAQALSSELADAAAMNAAFTEAHSGTLERARAILGRQTAAEPEAHQEPVLEDQTADGLQRRLTDAEQAELARRIEASGAGAARQEEGGT